MSKVSIEKGKIARFLELMILTGDIKNVEALVEITPEVIRTKLVSPNNLVATNGSLKGAFSDWGSIGVDDIVMLADVIKSLPSAQVELEKTENTIVVKLNKVKFASTLRSPQYIVNSIPEEKYQSLIAKAIGNEFVLKQETVKAIINHFNTISPDGLTLKGAGKVLTLKLSSQHGDLTVDFDLETEVKPFTVKLAKLFVDLLSVINDDITLSINNEAPVFVSTSKEDYKFDYIVAPYGK